MYPPLADRYTVEAGTGAESGCLHRIDERANTTQCEDREAGGVAS